MLFETTDNAFEFVDDPYDWDPSPYTITLYEILAGQSINFTSIVADNTANINSGTIYVGTGGENSALSVVDLSRNVLTDSYLIDKKGGFNEALDQTDINDINIGT